jgi:hypothetical protein
MRPDLGELEAGEEEIAELRLLLARRADLLSPTRAGSSLA